MRYESPSRPDAALRGLEHCARSTRVGLIENAALPIDHAPFDRE